MTPYENVTFKERLHEEAAKLKETVSYTHLTLPTIA